MADRHHEPLHLLRATGIVWLLSILLCSTDGIAAGPSIAPAGDPLKRAKIYLAAGDYRRTLEACHQVIDQTPSARGYVFLTYVYQALDAHLEYLAQTDRWSGVEHLYLNLAVRDPQDLLEHLDVLPRMEKEIIQSGSRRLSDMTAEMATRLDKKATDDLWQQQTAWRLQHPQSWWSGVPDSWDW